MNIRQLNQDDQRGLEAFLVPHKSHCMFICSNLKASGMEYKDVPFHGEYWGCFDDSSKNLRGVIVHYWNGNIMMCASDPEILSNLTNRLRQNIHRPIHGILGLEEQAKLVIEGLGLLDAKYNKNSTEGLYAFDLDELQEVVLEQDFMVITAKEVGNGLLIEWMKDYEVEALGTQQDSELDAKAEDKANRLLIDDCFVLIKNGTPVSLSAFNARLDDIMQIGPVWTPPEHRNHGFARTLVNFTLNEVKKGGVKKALLFTDNPAAIKAYEAIGFRKIGSYRLALLKEPFYVKRTQRYGTCKGLHFAKGMKLIHKE